jgi:hypothetical protein
LKPPDKGWPGRAAIWLGLSLAPAVFLEALRALNGAPFSATGAVGRWGWVLGVLLLARAGALRPAGGFRWRWPWRGVAILFAATAVVLGYAVTGATALAWAALGAVYVLLLILARGTWALTGEIGQRWLRGLSRLALLGAALATGGLLPVAVVQIESHFADEEFFVFLQALALALFFGLLLAVLARLSNGQAPSARGLRIDARLVWAGLVLLAAAGVWATVRSYQASFYPPEAPAFAGISPERPFLCGEAASPGAGHPDGEAVFQRLLARVEAKPQKRPPEYGMLALATGEWRWAEDFRRAVLEEARENRFAGPAHSVKSTQYEAALRLYYVWKIQEAFPDLFGPSDQALLREWFAAINQRAQTVEWVDWTYALAFSKWPEGPYENQENGAGLLALLEVSGYAAPELSAANVDYLARNERGWGERFRNTDDAYVYQLEWLHNAWFQSLYAPGLEPSTDNRRLSFEWLLLQSLPDGSVLRYNHPARASVASAAYLGASLLGDPNLLWLADAALTRVEAEGGYLYAQPGLEAPVDLAGEPPEAGSCLLYGDSGLPNQVGPLAPDKIVYRDGWSPDAAYALLNLRFSGWHRYKATNTLTLLYQGRPIVAEETVGRPFAWLPEGRSLFRDKRIPRENLNGLLIGRTGMSAVLYGLTGVGGPWAQDPPYYAEVVDFETGDELDWSHTRLIDWRGWQHDRWIYFYHGGGPVVVVDRAEGPPSAGSGLVWHLAAAGKMEGQRVRMSSGENPAEMLFLPVGVEGRFEAATPTDGSGRRITYHAPARDEWQIAAIFLPGEWAGAHVQVEEGEKALRIVRGEERLRLPLFQER